MGEAAVQVAQACGYVNAGTVEFLYQDGEFFFLEMNTRLQVEHPVTEMVTGIDLVAEQLRVAAGRAPVVHPGRRRAPRPRHRVPHQRRGPRRRRVPALARPHHQAAVPQGFGVRWDGGYESGDEVSQFYDNLVGKLIVWGGDREIARQPDAAGPRRARVEGVATTDPGPRRHPRPPRLRRGRALDQVGRGDASTCPASAPRPAPPPADGEDGRAEGAPRRRRRGQRPALRGQGLGAGVGRRAPWPAGGGAAAARPRRSAAGDGGAGCRRRHGHRARCRARS